MFALFEDDLKAICVVTDEGNNICELKNIATYPKFQGMGYGKQLVFHVCEYYAKTYSTMVVGTGDSPSTIPYYEGCGFTQSHRVKNFFVDNYGHHIFEGGKRLAIGGDFQKNKYEVRAM